MNINNLINVRRWTSDGCSGKQHRYDDISDHVGVGDDDEDDKIFGWQASMQEMTIAVDGDAWTIVTSTTLKSMSKAFKVQLPWNPKNVDKCTTILKSMSKLSRLLRAGCNDLDIQECTYMFISLEIYVKRLQGRLLNILHSNPHKRGQHEPFPIFLNFKDIIILTILSPSSGLTLTRRRRICEMWELVEFLRPASSSLSKRFYHHHHPHQKKNKLIMYHFVGQGDPMSNLIINC